jgi:hypothetical protein
MVPLSLLKYLHAVKRVIPPELRGINPKPSMSGGRWPASLPNSLAKENIKLLFGGHPLRHTLPRRSFAAGHLGS